jgi:hypothetical protein
VYVYVYVFVMHIYIYVCKYAYIFHINNADKEKGVLVKGQDIPGLSQSFEGLGQLKDKLMLLMFSTSKNSPVRISCLMHALARTVVHNMLDQSVGSI